MHSISCVFLTNNNDIQLSALIGKQMKRRISLKLKEKMCVKSLEKLCIQSCYVCKCVWKLFLLLFSATVLPSMSLDPFFHIMLTRIMLNWVVFFF